LGDLDQGDPELRQDVVTIKIVTFYESAFGASSDVMAIMVKTLMVNVLQYDTLK